MGFFAQQGFAVIIPIKSKKGYLEAISKNYLIAMENDLYRFNKKGSKVPTPYLAHITEKNVIFGLNNKVMQSVSKWATMSEEGRSSAG